MNLDGNYFINVEYTFVDIENTKHSYHNIEDVFSNYSGEYLPFFILFTITNEGMNYYWGISNIAGSIYDLWVVVNENEYFSKKRLYYSGLNILDLSKDLSERLERERDSKYFTLVDSIHLDCQSKECAVTVNYSFHDRFKKYSEEGAIIKISKIQNLFLDQIETDSDMDGLNDLIEDRLGLSKYNMDSDSDGTNDNEDNTPQNKIKDNCRESELYNSLIERIKRYRPIYVINNKSDPDCINSYRNTISLTEVEGDYDYYMRVKLFAPVYMDNDNLYIDFKLYFDKSYFYDARAIMKRREKHWIIESISGHMY